MLEIVGNIAAFGVLSTLINKEDIFVLDLDLSVGNIKDLDNRSDLKTIERKRLEKKLSRLY